MALEKPKLIYYAKIERTPLFRRFMWWLLAAVAAGGAGIALSYAADSNAIPNPQLLAIGQIVAVFVAALAILRAIWNLLVYIRRKNETLRFFDKGFNWVRSKDEAKYSWKQIVTFREGIRSLYLFGRPMLQVGAHVLTMRDGRVFKFTGAHGDTRKFAKAVRPYIADVTGTLMGQALRNKKSIRLHSELAMLPNGIRVGKQEIPWWELDIAVKNGKLVVYKLAPSGQFKPVKKIDTHEIDNLGGFVEVATSTIKNHQPERFNIKTYVQPQR